MIIRRLVVRQGRAIWTQSSRTATRSHATSSKAAEPNRTPAQGEAARGSKPSENTSPLSKPMDHGPARATRPIAEALDAHEAAIKALRADISAHTVTRLIDPADQGQERETSGASPGVADFEPPPTADPAKFKNLKALNRFRRFTQKDHKKGTWVSHTYNPNTLLRHPPTPSDLTLPMLLANQTHLGHATSLWNPANSSYIFGVRDGIHIISLDVTYAYLKRAAKVVQEVARRGGIILFVGTRAGQDEIVVNSAKMAGGYHIFQRWVPGSLTNGQQILGTAAVKLVDVQDRELPQYSHLFTEGHHTVMRPDLVICLNPVENQVCLHECGLFTVPTIGIIDTDANPAWVTYPIPANDDSFRSTALISGVLGQAGKEGQRLRMLEAAQGRATYDTADLRLKLDALEEIAAMDVQEPDRDRSPD